MGWKLSSLSPLIILETSLDSAGCTTVRSAVIITRHYTHILFGAACVLDIVYKIIVLFVSARSKNLLLGDGALLSVHFSGLMTSSTSRRHLDMWLLLLAKSRHRLIMNRSKIKQNVPKGFGPISMQYDHIYPSVPRCANNIFQSRVRAHCK